MLTPAQLRAARGLLKWTQQDLADRSGVHVNSIKGFEGGADPKRSTLLALEKALRAAGVVLIDADETHGEGAMLRKPGP